MEQIIITEAAKSNRKFKCPYCDYRNTRPNLVSHVNNKHEELIPQEYTAARVIFNYINNKTTGSCVICKKETKWNEDKWRYERFCSDKCVKKYVKEFKEIRMMNKYGKEHLLDDIEQQKKMLTGRKISGNYKWSDGTIKSYCGSYELKALECLDKVLHYSSADIETPGPVIDYDYKGETHKWITDIYIAPANLCIDVKDGGDNPNTRNMEDYRAKQNAKENAIRKINKYNYLRLTNNDFTQLLFTLSEIKELMIDDNIQDNYIIDINESVLSTKESTGIANTTQDVLNDPKRHVRSLKLRIRKPNYKLNQASKNIVPYQDGIPGQNNDTSQSSTTPTDTSTDNSNTDTIKEYTSGAGVGGIVGMNSANNVYIVPCYMNNTFIGTAISDDKYLSNVYVKDKDTVKKSDINELDGYDIKIYKYNKKSNQSIEKFNGNDCVEKCFEGYEYQI